MGAVIVAAISVYLNRKPDPDLWWYLKTGELIAATGAIPGYDSVSFPAVHGPWTNHEWGFHVMCYFLYSHFGDVGLTALKTLLGLGTVGFIYALTRSAHLGVHLLVFLLASQIIGSYARYRPQMVTFFLVAFLLWLLSRGEDTKRKALPTIYIPLIFLFWANLHAGFLAGRALLAGCFAVSTALTIFQPKIRTDEWARAKRTGILLLLSAIMTLANPYGYHLWEAVRHEMAVNAGLNHQYVREWASIWVTPLGMQPRLFFFMAGLATVAFVLRPSVWRKEEILLSAGTFALASSLLDSQYSVFRVGQRRAFSTMPRILYERFRS